MKTLTALFTPLFLVVTYLLFWPVSISPVAWDAPVNIGYQGAFASNQILANVETFSIEPHHGPEDFAMDAQGRLYTSTADGAILRFLPEDPANFEIWTNTGGRPLGIEFDADGNLIVADAYLGLLSINPQGDIKVLTDSANNVVIRYADDLDISIDGKIYFTDASTKFGAQENGGTYPASLLDLMEHGGHGRVLVYNPTDNSTLVIADNLNFANGVAISFDEQSILVIETGHYRVLKIGITPDTFGQIETLIENLPGFPDNITRGSNGRYWVGLASVRNNFIDNMSAKPMVRSVAQRLPETMRPKAERYSHVIALNDSGKVIASLQDPDGRFAVNTGVWETPAFLFISSLLEHHIARLPISEAGIQ